MADNSFLPILLEKGLLDISDDDKRFVQLERAAANLASAFEKEPSKVIHATLVAIDEGAGPDEPIYEEAEEALKAEWKTLRGRHKERPRGLLRAIIWEALRIGAEREPLRVGGVVWLTLSMASRYLTSPEGECVAEALEGWSSALETSFKPEVAKEASRGTSSPPSFSVPPEQGKVDLKLTSLEAELQAMILSAASPQGPAHPKIGGHNRAWPQNGQPTWPQDFSKYMAKTLIEAFKVLETGVNHATQVPLKELQTSLNTFLKKQEAWLSEHISAAHAQVSISELMTQTLWWSKALYSPTLQRSYRDLKPLPATLQMARDLHTLCQAPTPASVSYLLRESLRELLGETAEAPLPFQEVLEQLGEHSATLGDGWMRRPRAPNRGRISLTDFLERFASGELESSALTASTGVDAGAKISLPDLAMWIFRDLQALALADGARS